MEAALIAAVQYIEHYEIAGYGAVRSFARQLGDDESANLLQQTLNEEAHMDRLLSELAEYEVNFRMPKFRHACFTLKKSVTVCQNPITK